MGKAIVKMKNWELYVYDGRYNLSGMADKHPRLGKNVYIRHTSHLVRYQLEEDVLEYETRNTIYRCPLKYMAVCPYMDVVMKYKKELVHQADNSNNILDKIIAVTGKLALYCDRDNPWQRLSDKDDVDVYLNSLDFSNDDLLCYIQRLQEEGQKELAREDEIENQRLIENAKQYEDCIYLEVSDIDGGDKLAYHLDYHTGIVKPLVHVGTYQDSVLYMKHAGRGEDKDCALDFRYFPMGWRSMDTYSWSDNIKLAVIKNAADYVISFNRVEIQVGETMVFTPEGHFQGLISPDCYNGKSVFSPKRKE